MRWSQRNTILTVTSCYKYFQTLVFPHLVPIAVFEGDEETYTFSARTEEDRDSWIQCLHDASYECLKMQLQSLREQVQAKTGQDPMVNMLPSDTAQDFETRVTNDANDPAMEISLGI